jgi:hypothetical protein
MLTHLESLPCSIRYLAVEPGGQRYFQPNKPLLSLSLPCGVRDCAAKKRATRAS